MSKLQELIDRLCPNGVEFKPLGEIFEMRNGYTPSKNQLEFWEGGTIPWFRMEDIRENGRILSDSIQHITPAAIKGKGLFEANTFILATTATIGEHALIIADSLANQRFTNLKVRKSLANILNTKFIFYYMFIVDEFCKNNTNVSGFASVDMDKLKRMPFPIPPLEVQEEIVRILDRFSEYAAELQAELQARKEQYEYYRNLLLTFNPSAYGYGTDDEQKDCVTPWGGRSYTIQWKKMGEIGTFIRGKRFVRTDIIDEGIPCIHYGDMYTYYGLYATKTRGYINKEIAKKMRYAEKNDIVIVAAGENKDDLGNALAWLGEAPAAVHDACFIFRSKMYPNFLSHVCRTKFYHNQVRMYANEAKICSVSGMDLAKVIIPLPPYNLQVKIASILDRFETLVNDLSKGLPAEIEAVRERYEYYRNKLLTFKEIPA